MVHLEKFQKLLRSSYRCAQSPCGAFSLKETRKTPVGFQWAIGSACSVLNRTERHGKNNDIGGLRCGPNIGDPFQYYFSHIFHDPG